MTQLADTTTYESALLEWHEKMADSLRGENGWLKLAGLFWLNEGDNTVGSAPDADVILPESVPVKVGVIHFEGGVASFRSADSVTVSIDGTPVTEATLRNDNDEKGPSRVVIGAVRFHVIKREKKYGVRILDNENPALKTFAGRQWFPADPNFHVAAKFTPHPEPRALPVINSVGLTVPMNNLGVVDFTLQGQTLRLEAFEDEPGSLWFIYKDKTNGDSTYGAGRFLVATVDEAGNVDLDFNRSYSPPCAFTPYATCPFAPRENHLPIRIEAGEQATH